MSVEGSDPAPILDLLNGFRQSKVLFTLVRLGIPDALSLGPQSAGALSVSLSVAEPSLSLLLDAAVSIGLLTRTKDQYDLTAVAREYLPSTSRHSFHGYILHSEKVVYPLWTNLHSSVQTGTNAWYDTFGLDIGSVFANMYKSPEDILQFMIGMHSFSKMYAPAVVKAFDLSQFRHVVDLGGSTGATSAAACQANLHITAVVVDLPHVVDLAKKKFTQPPWIEDTALLERITWVAADFFAQEDLVPEGDLFVVSRILHDWDDARCEKLLRLIHRKLTAGGAVLVAEQLVDECGTSPSSVLLQSLNMLVQTHGRERKLSEFERLLTRSGFSRIEGKRTGQYLDAVIGYK